MEKQQGSRPLVLLWRFLTKPRQIGAVCPSSRYLCRTMVSSIGLEEARAIVELGPGTGVVTREILHRKRDEADFFAVELDTDLYQGLQINFPELTSFNASASDLSQLCQDAGVTKLNAVISGLPWAAFPESLQREILDAIVANLREDGYFTTFAYLQGLLLPAGRRFRNLLNEYFQNVSTSRVVWRNMPPAIVYRCSRRISRD